MARRKRKSSSSSVFGAFVIEGLALVVFIFLFSQARAERQKESGVEKESFPLIEQVFEQTPLQGLLAHGRT